MTPTPPSPAEGAANQLLVQAERIARSPQLSGADIPRNLLAFLVKAAIERPGESVREAEIAAAVLGRKDFDARLDSGVRVHTARLRAKLAEYYLDEGASDPLILEIPKRSYQLLYRNRAGEAQGPDVHATHPRRWPRFLPWAIAALASCLAVIGWTVDRRPAVPPALRTFWSPFLDPGQTMVVFSTPHFTASDAPEGLRQVLRNLPPGTPIVTDYTGVGELVAVSRLTNLFSRFGRDVHLKRSELATWDDARQQSLILVGGPNTNAVLAALPQPSRFIFTSAPNGGDGVAHSVIEDRNPAPGGARYYQASGRPYRYDHAIVAYTPARTSGRPILVLAGLSTMGTQAAAEYVTDPGHVTRLISTLRAGDKYLPAFEVLLKTTVRDGSPVSTEVLTVHGMSPRASPRD